MQPDEGRHLYFFDVMLIAAAIALLVLTVWLFGFYGGPAKPGPLIATVEAPLLATAEATATASATATATPSPQPSPFPVVCDREIGGCISTPVPVPPFAGDGGLR